MTAVQDARPQYLTALDQLEKLFATITPADLDRPTPVPSSPCVSC